ncbi:hypothetical protein COT60_03925 [Candidatus Pacearchaeota archaeon CG09_land_8_20_14_0_10_30_9]|nr:MAG: hypothetical protein QJ16_C0018G0006 [archaeon GW2011_AR1]MBS3078331.1 hypothetical protein [Candidatus Pacearchaeota archaeon]OIO39827.1 MAG: hypothetical protein AUJ61_03330 [Candidatus Pacearchaeota archaeon CG1_02_30_18]PIN71332.1 MAG: hypothetical protein COV77_02515 [Candidatus Pacearchaeota archaeon CG11_big_fil_rev_8_21_14_0_20_30_13]PIO00776.1 MAG: hypothetical protein COT60_03925 [Candidatus Pacearchaeota archaeon CG09_land_8_20_14_0_10_30_9]HIH52173.1 hypothetical protein [N
MKIKYFKNYGHLGDCYVGQKEKEQFNFFKIVSISKSNLCLLANDESSNYQDGRFDGLYRMMNVSKKNFNQLQNLAGEQNRKEGLNLIRKMHEKNPEKGNSFIRIEGNLENFDWEKNLEVYQNSKPILE